MNKIQLTTYKSIIGSLALETVNNPNNSEDVKTKDWFKKTYKVYKKFNQAKKVEVNPVESKAIKSNIEKILVGLRDKYFYIEKEDGYEVNNYSLICEILAHLVYEKNLIEFLADYGQLLEECTEILAYCSLVCFTYDISFKKK